MSKNIDGVEYLNTLEAIRLAGVSRQTFYNNVKPYLRPYHFGKKVPSYNKQEVLAFASGKPLRRAAIAITGMFANWTEHARSLGCNVETVSRETTIERLPAELAATFNVSDDRTFVRRSEMSWVDRQPICTWSSWYPLDLVSPVLAQIQDGSFRDIVGYIASRGNIIREVNDVYSSRITTFEEQSLFQLLNAEPLLVLQRMARTEDNRVVMLYQDMQLLGSWFVVRRTENVHYWDK